MSKRQIVELKPRRLEPEPRQRRHKPLSKNHRDHWKARLFHNTYTRDGVVHQVSELSVKIQHLGRRHTFPLGTTNREVAAEKARAIYTALVANGWDAVMAQENPEMVERADDPTVGEFLTEVESKANLRPKTFHNYAACLRTIISDVFRFDTGAAKFDYRGDGNKRWRENVDGIRLAKLTPDKVQEWRVAFLRERGSNPAALQSARRTVNSYIRCARSLFSGKITKFVKVRLPKPLPFDGLELEKTGSMRYRSTIKAQLLIAAARNELRAAFPECYKAFLLALFCGLRRAEMDNLEWSAIDWQNNTIIVANTAVLSVKTDGSEGVVEVDVEVLEELRTLMAGSQSKFVLHSHLPPRPDLQRQYYRCEQHFDRLLNWLRGKGVSSRKPLHELRKEFGSLVNQRHGLFAASQALRHSDITTSARHYVAKKERITAGLGGLLKPQGVEVVRDSAVNE